MKKDSLNKDITNAIMYAGSAALKKGQNYVNTAKAFDGVLRLFVLNKDVFSTLNSEIKAVFGKYGINSTLYNEAYEMLYPVSDNVLDNSIDAVLSDDLNNAVMALAAKAESEKRTQDIVDFLSQLFSDKSYSLFLVFDRISLNLKSNYDAAVDAGVKQEDLPPISFDTNILYADLQKIFMKSAVREVKSLESEDMQRYLTNINKYVAKRADFKLVGMEHEMTALEIALAGRTKKSAVLVGPAGTGKTSLVYELANRINNNDDRLPELLKSTIVYELHMDELVAGSKFRGQFEQRLKVVLDAVSKLPNVILFIDEFHTMIKAGGSGTDSGGDQTGGNILKPYLSRGDVWVIGATTDGEFNEYVEKDKAIARRFKKVLIVEPTKEETIEIMRGVLPIDEKFFDKTMSEELLTKVYSLSTQYNLQTSNPDKALSMLESAFAYAKVCKAQNKAEETKKELKSFLLGQDKPLSTVSKYLKMIDRNLVNPEKPKCSLLLAGPTGVGKTETAKIIAKYFTGSERNLVSVEGSSMQHETGVSTLLGADAGYVGYSQTSPFLAQVKQNPNCVVLFDEIEKAHPAVFKALLNILDEGYAKDKGGNKISFRNAIIIFTTNLGYGSNNHTGSGMMSNIITDGTAINEINKHFSPEFIGRLDEIITYNKLDSSVAKQLIERYRKKYAELSGTDVQFTTANINKIKKESNIATLGARNLDHCVKSMYLECLEKAEKGEKK